ncbi:hypothetical protein ID850_16385 [Xenorhabdus sp. Flor]|uniref:hypothetical protein n=1 Tax=Xenorhabdus cabanillasii TaxID=351673 RepID=UPI00198E1AFF|nr:hypothetical protein [Xenorhabdus sp. Flor]MBD2816282.1 hypothetical protein [Xenorhabdus sp. Flor]
MEKRIEELEIKIEMLEKQLVENQAETSRLNNDSALKINEIGCTLSLAQQSFHDVLAKL